MNDRDKRNDIRIDSRGAPRTSPSRKPTEGGSASGGPAIIPRQRLVALATLAARLQKSSLRQARAPKAVTTAIRELNTAARLAGDVLAGKKEAERAFRREIARPAHGFLGPLFVPTSTPAVGERGIATGTAPSDLSGGPGGRPDASPGGGSGGGPRLQRPCGELLAGTQDVLQVAFQLDVRDGARQPARTAEAATYLRTRMGLVAQYERALWQGAGGDAADRPVAGSGGVLSEIPGEDFGGFGDPTDPTGGFGGPSEPILPPDDGGLPPPGVPPDPPPDSGGPGGLGPGLCETLGDLCVALFEQAVAGVLGDPYLDLLASVEPDCICHDYDPNQIFIGRPAQGQSFPVPLPADVRLIFRGQDITANIVGVTAQELSFRIPPNSQTGNVLLRGPFVNQPSGGGNLERLCGFDFPDFPGSLNPDTPVLISIIHPPVIASFTADDDPGPIVVAEACQSLNLCWQVHLDDPNPNRPIPACARIEVTVRNQAGDILRQDGPQSCVAVTSAAEETFTLEARSFARNHECGHAGPVALTIQRVARLDLIRDTPAIAELDAGTNGRFLVELSCPAPAGGIEVRLTSSQPQALQVPASVPIPAGQTRMPVDFTTAADGRGPVFVRAMASAHQEGRLEYELFQSPAESCQAFEDMSGSWAHADQSWSNWGIVDSNETFLGFLPAPKLFRPTTQYELARAIQQAEADGKTARALGSGWGFSETVLPQSTAIQGGAQIVAAPLRLLALGGALNEAQLHNVARNFSDNFGYAIDTTTLDRSLQTLLPSLLADDLDPAGFFFVEAGMTINFLNTLLDEQNPRRALRTMGGSSGQTIAGAFSTGTHGGDFDRPPLADAVRAIYLVGAGGVHHWIEPANPITDPAKLRRTFPCLADSIHYDDDMFRSVLVSMGAMGVIYAVILEVVPQYSLLQWNKWSTWETFKAEASPNSFAGLFDGTWTGMRDFLRANPSTGNPLNRFAQVVVNPIREEDGSHRCYVSNRVELPLQERRGVIPLTDYTKIDRAEIRDAIENSPQAGFHEKANFHFHGPPEEGELLELLQNLLIFCKENNYPWAVRAVINRVMEKTFPEPGNPPDPQVDVGYKVMAGGGTSRAFPTLGGTAVESAFSFFPTVPSLDQPGLQVAVPDAISFIDTVLAAFDQGVNSENKIFPAGWLSLRVTGRTDALLGMERFERSGMVELSLIGRPDGYGVVRLVEQLTRTQGGALHWGQSNGMVRFIDLESTYGNVRIDKWKAAQRVLGGDTFTNLFMRRCGLA
jgi:hypothetical protein